MSQFVYILSDKSTRSYTTNLSNAIYTNGIFETDEFALTADILERMAKFCTVDYFYVITPYLNYDLSNFDFSFKPPEWDKEYMHMWKNNCIRLFNKDAVLKNPKNFTSAALYSGEIRIKNIDTYTFAKPVYDIVFLSYDEPYADAQYEKLRKLYPRIKRVHGVKGIMNAHKEAANLVSTDMFFVVDADADVLPTFNFDYVPTVYDVDKVHVWHSLNPVNNLEYGYGGVKLFPTLAVREYKGNSVDFTTSVSTGFRLIQEVSNRTNFCIDPVSAWRSGFRECAKLATQLDNNPLDKETEFRLHTWCNVATGEFGEFVIMGANEGAEFARLHKNQPEMLRLINDFEWLDRRFSS